MGHYREILPNMVSVSNNSILTNRVAVAIADKLSDDEFYQFQQWLKLVAQQRQIEINNSKNGIQRFRNF